MGGVLVMTNCASRAEAVQIADALLEARLVAAAQILGPTESRFWWQGAVRTREEWALVVKTSTERAAVVMSRIDSMHSYVLPATIRIDIGDAAPAYLRWLNEPF